MTLSARCEHPAFPSYAEAERTSCALSLTPTFPCFSSLYTLIPLCGENGEREFARVSVEDHFYLSLFDWFLTKTGYITTKEIRGFGRFAASMHRVVAERMGIIYEEDDSRFIDHRNRSRVDNQRINLRCATPQQNAFNSERPVGSTGYIGVRKSGKARFSVCISTGESTLTLSSYGSAPEAARVRDALARHYHGEFAVTNFPGSEAYDAGTAKAMKESA